MGRLLFALALAAALVWVPAPAARAYVELTGNARGDQVLVHQVLGQHNQQLFAGLPPADGSFGPFAPLTGPVDPVERASVIDDAGGAAVAWVTNEVAYEPPTGHVMAAIRPPQGGFEPPVELAPNARYLRLYGNGRGDVL